MKKYLSLALALTPSVLFGAAGDILVRQTNSAGTAWKDVILTPLADSLIGFNSSGIPQIVTVGSGLSLSSGILTATGGSGTVTSASVVTANGVSATVATATTTPAFTFTLGAITPTSVNSVVLSGSSTPTLAVTGTSAISGTNTGDQTSVTGNAGTATALATGRTIGMTGDLVWTSPSFDGSGNVTAAGTLATVNSNVGSFGSTTAIPVVTVNAKGLVTAASTAAVVAPAGTLTGTTLASGVTASSLTSFGTSPAVSTSLTTGSTTFALLNTTATTINAFGAATTVNTGASATQIWNFGGSTTASEFRFLEPSGSGTNYTALKSQAQSANITYTLPPAVAAAGGVLTDVSGNGSLTWVVPGAGSGTVTVVSSGSLTSTALVTGGGTTTLQTPSSTATLDSSGNISTPGSISTGVGGSVGGYAAFGQGTATTAPTSSVGFQAPTSVTTKFMMTLPGAPTTGFFLNTGTTDPSTISFVAFTGTGNVVRDTAPQISTIELGAASDTTLSRSAAGVLAVEGVVVPSISSTSTLTNKRVTARITTITSSGTPTVNTDNCDCVTITALAAAITSMTTNLTGTPSNFDQLEFRIKDDGTARAITWGASFAAGPTALPTTTTISKALHVFFEWDSVQSKWVCLSAGSDA